MFVYHIIGLVGGLKPRILKFIFYFIGLVGLMYCGGDA